MNKKILIKTATAVLLLFSLLLISSCGKKKNEDDSLLAAEGAGRITSTETETSDDSIDPLPNNGITICVDPGHGFDDPGTFSDLMEDLYEKDISLAVSKYLKQHLESLGFNVIMTHDGNTFPKTAIDDGNNKFRPEERVSYANSLGNSIDYYLSLHCNYYPNSSDVNGVRLYYSDYADPNTQPDLEISEAIAAKIATDFPDDKEPTVSTEKFYVIRFTKVPACLIEMGFVSNQGDVDKMIDPEWQDKFAKSLADALYNYYVPSSN